MSKKGKGVTISERKISPQRAALIAANKFIERFVTGYDYSGILENNDEVLLKDAHEKLSSLDMQTVRTTSQKLAQAEKELQEAKERMDFEAGLRLQEKVNRLKKQLAL